MAATGSLIPARIDQHAVVGGDFASTVQLFSDVAQAVAFDLTGYTVTATIGGGLLVLTDGGGLTVTAATGTVIIALTAVQTAALGASGQAYYLKLVDGSGTVSFPLDGTLFLTNP